MDQSSPTSRRIAVWSLLVGLVAAAAAATVQPAGAHTGFDVAIVHGADILDATVLRDRVYAGDWSATNPWSLYDCELDLSACADEGTRAADRVHGVSSWLGATSADDVIWMTLLPSTGDEVVRYLPDAGTYLGADFGTDVSNISSVSGTLALAADRSSVAGTGGLWEVDCSGGISCAASRVSSDAAYESVAVTHNNAGEPVNAYALVAGGGGIHRYGWPAFSPAPSWTRIPTFSTPNLDASDIAWDPLEERLILATGAGIVQVDPQTGDVLNLGGPAVNARFALDTDARRIYIAERGASHLARYALPSSVIYVDGTSSPFNQDGQSWLTAYNELSDALAVAGAGQQIWVAQGTYAPTGTARTDAFVLPPGVRLYGGFPNGGLVNDRSLADPTTFVTTLSGERGLSGLGDNHHHVLQLVAATSTTIVDGFTVTAGSNIDVTCSPGCPDAEGGGMHAWLTNDAQLEVSRTTFTGNHAVTGGGVFVRTQNTAEAHFIDTVVENNLSGSGNGGGLFGLATDGRVDLTRITANTNITEASGGGLFLLADNGELSIDGATLTGNRANGTLASPGLPAPQGRGGGAWITARPGAGVDSVIDIRGVVATGNYAAHEGGGLYVDFQPLALAGNDVLRLANSTASTNSADKGAGAYVVARRGTVAVGNVTSRSNTATTSGGGLSVYAEDQATVSIANLLSVGNFADLAAGLDVEVPVGPTTNTTVELDNATINDNERSGGNGGAVAANPQTTLNNSIIFGNTQTAGGDAPFVLGRSPAAVDNSICQNPGCATLGTNNQNQNPGLDANYVPTATGLAHEAGDVTLLPFDVGDVDGDGDTAEVLPTDNAGAVRVVGTLDIGAREAGDSVIPVNRAPSVTITDVSPDPVLEGSTVTVTYSVSDPEDDVASRTPTVLIDWGDGTSDTASYGINQTATHAYAGDRPSPYPITITATDSEGLEGQDADDVQVTNAAPVASLKTLAVNSGTPADIDTDPAPVTASGEGLEVTVTFDFTDPGSQDTHTAQISWGDATALSIVDVSGPGPYAASHTYQDNQSPAPVITLTVSDGAASDSDQHTHTVVNVVPDITVDSVVASPEGSASSITFTYTDPGADDRAAAYAGSITWGDGTTTSMSTISGSDVVLSGPGVPTTIEHVYDDECDPAANTCNVDGAYIVGITIRDKDLGEGTASTAIDVGNAAPEVQGAAVTPSPSAEGQLVTLDFDIVDPGTDDEFSYTIDWGDGTAPEVVSSVPADPSGTTPVQKTHTYVDDPGLAAGGPDVLLLSQDGPGFKPFLDDMGEFGSVDTFDPGSLNGTTPTLADLEPYDVVYVWNRGAGYSDAVALGDVLADYVDGGGAVVQGASADNVPGIFGRWKSDGYEAHDPSSNGAFGSFDLVPVEPTHPILDGVGPFNGGARSYRGSATAVTPGAQIVANWTSPGVEPLVTVADPAIGRIVTLNFWPIPTPEGGGNSYPRATSDGLGLIRNTLLYVARGPAFGAITIEVSDGGTEPGTAALQHDVYNVAPDVVSNTPPADATEGTETTLTWTVQDPAVGNDTYTATVDVDGAGTAPSGTVTVGTPDASGTFTVTATHTYPASGDYTATLNVTDEDGGDSDVPTPDPDAPMTVMVANVAPTVVIGSMKPMADESTDSFIGSAEGHVTVLKGHVTDPGTGAGDMRGESLVVTVVWDASQTTPVETDVVPVWDVETSQWVFEAQVRYDVSIDTSVDPTAGYTVRVTATDGVDTSDPDSIVHQVDNTSPTFEADQNASDLTASEGEADGITLVVDYADPAGSADHDLHLTIDWGDGTTTSLTTEDPFPAEFDASLPPLADPTSPALPVNETYPDVPANSVSVPHTYADQCDADTDRCADGGGYDIRVDLTDADDRPRSLQPESVATATVTNVAPTIENVVVGPATEGGEGASAPTTSNEGDTIRLAFDIVDPGTDDRFDVTIDWGDGSQPHVEVGVFGSLNFTHTYADDGALSAGAIAGIAIGVVDASDAGSSATATHLHDVLNVAPDVLSNPPASGSEGDEVTLTWTFTDPGQESDQTYTATVDPGDATALNGSGPTISGPVEGVYTATATHTYAQDGSYTAVLRVTDKDGATNDPDVDTEANLPVSIDNIAPTVTITSTHAEPVTEGTEVTVTFEFSDPAEDGPYAASVVWGDGFTDDSVTGTVTLDGNTGSASHIFAVSNDAAYRVAVTVEETDASAGPPSAGNVALVTPLTLTIAQQIIDDITEEFSGTPPWSNIDILTVRGGSGASCEDTTSAPFAPDLSGYDTVLAGSYYFDHGPSGCNLSRDYEVGNAVATFAATAPVVEFGALWHGSDAMQGAWSQIRPYTRPAGDCWLTHPTVSVSSGPGAASMFDGLTEITFGRVRPCLEPGNGGQNLVRHGPSANVLYSEATTEHSRLVAIADDALMGNSGHASVMRLLGNALVWSAQGSITPGGGTSGSASVDVTVNNTSPIVTIEETSDLTGLEDGHAGDTVTVDFTYGDWAGRADNHFVGTIVWGDGATTSLTTQDLSLPGLAAPDPSSPTLVTSATVSLGHTYADDGDYAITITVRDQDDVDDAVAVESADTTAEVGNVAPTVLDITTDADGPVDEMTSVTATFTFSDPAGAGDAPYAATIDFGDGSAPVSATVTNVEGDVYSATATHSYADDQGTADGFEGNDRTFTVTPAVSDHDGAPATEVPTTTVSVLNVAPQVEVTAAPDSVDEGVEFELSFDFSDVAGAADEPYTAWIDWDDGNEPQPVSVTAPGPYTVNHTYAQDDAHTITVRVGDDGCSPPMMEGPPPGVDPALNVEGPGFLPAADCEGTALHSISVRNVVPNVVIDDVQPAPYTEGDGDVTVTFHWTDSGADTYVGTVDFGDGVNTTVEATLDQGAKTGTAVLAGGYIDDDPTATDGDTYAIVVSISDDDATGDSESWDFDVANEAPLAHIAGVFTEDAEGLFADSDEGEEVVLYFGVTDAGDDTFPTISIDWGDGSSSDQGDVEEIAPENTAVPCVPESRRVVLCYAATHTYGDDGSATAGSGVYEISVTATDDDGATSVPATHSHTVHNVDPTVTITQMAIGNGAPVSIEADGSTSVSRERREVHLTFALADPASPSTEPLDVTIDWGDGLQIEAVAEATSPGTYTVSHTYLDDDPFGTFDAFEDGNDSADGDSDASGVFTIRVSAADDDTGTHADSHDHEVTNVAPIITGFDAQVPADMTEDRRVTLTVDWTDPTAVGTPDEIADSYALIVNWGDGTPLEIREYGQGSLQGQLTHHYRDDNPTATAVDFNAIDVLLVDDDQDELSREAIDAHQAGEEYVDPSSWAVLGSQQSGRDIDVRNVPPTLAAGVFEDEGTPSTSVTITEDGVITVTGTVTDPGEEDTFVLTIDWDTRSETDSEGVDTLEICPDPEFASEGCLYVTTPGTAPNTPTTWSFFQSHHYVDDGTDTTGWTETQPKAGSLSETYPILVAVTDDDGESDTDPLDGNPASADRAATELSVTVDNDAPVLAITHTSEITEDGWVRVWGTVTDAGADDWFELVLDWDTTDYTTTPVAGRTDLEGTTTLYRCDDPVHGVGETPFGLAGEPGSDTCLYMDEYADFRGGELAALDIGFGNQPYADSVWHFEAWHRYQDDGPQTAGWGDSNDGTASYTYPLDVTVTDDDGASDTETPSVLVNDDAPTIEIRQIVIFGAGEPRPVEDGFTVAEDETIYVDGSIYDAGADDWFSMTVDFGDGGHGTPGEVTLYRCDDPLHPATGRDCIEVVSGPNGDEPSTFSFVRDHHVTDDAGSQEGSARTLRLAVTEDDGLGDDVEIAYTVGNVAPVLLVDDAEIDDTTTGDEQRTDDLADDLAVVIEDGTVALRGSVTDASSQDTFTLTIDWGDGSAAQEITTFCAAVDDVDCMVAPDETDTPNNATTWTFLTSPHPYADNGDYAVVVTLADDEDGAPEPRTFTVRVTNAGPTVDVRSVTVTDEDGAATTYDDGTGDNPAIGDVEGRPTVGTSEDGTATISGVVFDLGAPDSVELVVDWGDETEPETIVCSDPASTENPEGSSCVLSDAGSGANDPTEYAFTTTTHHYVDGDAVYVVSLLATDKDLGVGPNEIDIDVANIAPAVAIDSIVGTEENTGEAVVTATLTDPGAGDAMTVTVDWGDGSGLQTVTQACGEGATTNCISVEDAGEGPHAHTVHSVTAQHRYVDDPDGVPTDFTVTVTVDDEVTSDDVAAADDTATITDVAPTVLTLTADKGTEGTPAVTESGSVSFEGRGDDRSPGDTIAYTWTIEAWDPDTETASAFGGTYNSAGGTVAHDGDGWPAATLANVTFPDSGMFRVTLTVQDDDGLSSSDAIFVTIDNVAPTAEANGPYSGRTAQSISVTAAGSTDPGNDIVSYTWSATGGSFTENGSAPDDPSTPTAVYSAGQTGNYTLTVTVCDVDGDCGQDTATANVSADGNSGGGGGNPPPPPPANTAPTAEAGGPYSGETGAAITVSGSGSTDPESQTLTYAWDLDDDGQYDDASGVSTTVTKPTAGTYTIGLQVTDTGGLTGTDTAQVTVSDPPPPPPPSEPDTATRLAGPEGTSRVETAAAISQASYPTNGSAEVVVLARTDVFADALAGTAFAAGKDGPLLLTQPPGDSTTLHPATKAELRRVLRVGKTVYLLGGPNALAPELENELRTLGFTPVRLSGPSRVETAIAIADATTTSPSEVFLADGNTFQSAMIAGPAAHSVGGVVILTNGSSSHPAVDDYLADHAAATTTTVGRAARTAYPSTDASYVGSSDQSTSTMVATAYFAGTSRIGAARVDVFADALAGGVHIARQGGAIVLTNSTFLSSVVRTYLESNAADLSTAYIYGGPNAISDSTKDAILAAIS